MAPGDSFYLPDGDQWVATELTRGPWSEHHQHGGPVAALLARTVRVAIDDASFAICRITIELARPAPIGRLAVSATAVHRGRTVATWSAAVEHEGKLIAKASALALRRRQTELPTLATPDPPPPVPSAAAPFALPFELAEVGYHTAMEGRVARAPTAAGRCFVWFRMRHPLVPGEAPAPLERVLIAADAANGASAVLDPRRFGFLNADLVVALQRHPATEWVGLDAATRVEPTGIGLTDTQVFDEHGPIGRGIQTLVIEARGA